MSPTWQPKDINAANIIRINNGIILWNIREKKITGKNEKIKDPRLPEIVLFGLILVSLGPLKSLPNINPPTSEKIQINTHK